MENFDDRATDRAGEMEGLTRAKELLSGASLVQEQKTPVPLEAKDTLVKTVPWICPVEVKVFCDESFTSTNCSSTQVCLAQGLESRFVIAYGFFSLATNHLVG